MKRVIMGILLGLTILNQPITAHAQCAVFPRTHDIRTNINEFTYEEAQELMQIAWCEAGNQGIDGQKYVMSVVLNRVESEDFPDTIHEVIYQEGQFATSGMTRAKITPETHYALCEIEMGNVAPEIIAFERTDSDCLDAFFDEAFDYRDHTFYTKKH